MEITIFTISIICILFTRLKLKEKIKIAQVKPVDVSAEFILLLLSILCVINYLIDILS